jgi:biotin carboxyl carrier protein
VDTGVRQGDAVSIFYDPMISKLIAWGETRDDALRTMSAALRQYQVVGLPNNLEFLQATVRHPLFVAGGVDTSFLAYHLHECLPGAASPSAGAGEVAPSAAAATPLALAHPEVAAVVAVTSALQACAPPAAGGSPQPSGPWSAASPLLLSRPGSAPLSSSAPADRAAAPFTLQLAETGAAAGSAPVSVTLRPQAALPAAAATSPAGASGGSFTVLVGGAKGAQAAHPLAVSVVSLQRIEGETAARSAIPGFTAATTGKTSAGAIAHAVKMAVGPAAAAGAAPAPQRYISGTLVTVTDAAGSRDLTFYPDSATDAPTPGSGSPAPAPTALPYCLRFTQPAVSWGKSAGGARRAAVVTPMPGKVVKVMAAPGAVVAEGAPLLVLEAMKMEHVIKAPAAGVVAAVHYREGDFVEDGRELVAFEDPKAAAAAAAAKK